jgi:hypothetical protein
VLAVAVTVDGTRRPNIRPLVEQACDVMALAGRRPLGGPVHRRPRDQPVAEDRGRDGATKVAVEVAAMAFQVDVEQTGSVHGGGGAVLDRLRDAR